MAAVGLSAASLSIATRPLLAVIATQPSDSISRARSVSSSWLSSTSRIFGGMEARRYRGKHT